MPEVMLSVRDLRKSFGALIATDSVSLDISEGEIHAVIGPNGAGKTTLIHQLAGMMESDSGNVMFEGRDVTALPAPARVRHGLVRSFQITSVLRDFSALDNVALAIQAGQGHSFRFWGDARRDPSLRAPALSLLSEVGLASRADVRAGILAHGEQRQLEIAMALIAGFGRRRPKMPFSRNPASGRIGMSQSCIRIPSIVSSSSS